jgi:hypothetical protein
MVLAKRWEVTDAMNTIYARLAAGNVYQLAPAGGEH